MTEGVNEVPDRSTTEIQPNEEGQMEEMKVKKKTKTSQKTKKSRRYSQVTMNSSAEHHR